MSHDALDRVRYGKFGKKEKQEYAKNKAEQEEKILLNDSKKVSKTSIAFRKKIDQERMRLGLNPIYPEYATSYEKMIHGCCKKCFRMNCICEVE